MDASAIQLCEEVQGWVALKLEEEKSASRTACDTIQTLDAIMGEAFREFFRKKKVQRKKGNRFWMKKHWQLLK